MPTIVTVFIGLGGVVLLIIMTSIAKMFRKAGPNEALIVYGFRGPRLAAAVKAFQETLALPSSRP